MTMSVNSDASRSIRDEAHQKLDALLYSISSRQLERVYGVQRDDDDAAVVADAEAASSPPPAPPLPPARQSTTTSIASSQRQRNRGERTPPSVRWKDVDDYDAFEGEDDGFATRLAFPPLEDFEKKLSELRRKQKRGDDLNAAAASFDDEMEHPRPRQTEAENLTPYVDALLNYVHFLEKEKSDFAAELEKLRRNVGLVARENAHLHKEVKRGFLEAVVRGGADDESSSGGVVDAEDAKAGRRDDAVALLQSEMEKMAKRHDLETKRLMDKAEAIETEKEELRTALKAAEEEGETIRQEVDKLRGNDAQKIVESLLNERNSLSTTVMEMSRKLKASKIREEELTNKLKKTVLVADQSLFERDEMALREERARKELEEERTSREEEERKREENMKEEREKVDRAAGNRVAALEEALATTEAEMIKMREKLKVVDKRKGGEEEEKKRRKGEEDEIDTKRLELIKHRAINEDGTRGQTTPPIDAMELRQRQQAEDRLRQEIVNYEAKTRSLERDLTAARSECVKLHEKMAEAERDASLARLKKETMAKFRFDDAKETREEAERKIEEARRTAEAWRQKYTDDVDELKTLAFRQSELINQLKEECVSLSSSLESASAQSEAETQKRLSESERSERLLSSKSEELKREKQRSKKLGDSARKLKRDVARLTSVVGDQKAQILEMNEAVAKAIADRQMQAKENEFLRQIHLPTPTQRHLRSPSAASSSMTGANRLVTTPPLISAPTLMMTTALSDPDVRVSTAYHATVGEES